MTNIKQTISTLEIYGADVLFSGVWNEYSGDEGTSEQLFYCDSVLCSTDMANGYSIFIEGYEFSHCVVLKNGMLVAVCTDEDEQRHYIRVEEYSGFVELEGEIA